MRYGLPYKGSKNFIAEWVVSHLPNATHFYDLFAGGCAITHAAALSGKFKCIHSNDIQGQYPELFMRAIRGDYKDEKRWISRDDFFKLKDSDPYIASCWSFGNHCQTYMYGEEIEDWKRALHYAYVLGDFDEFAKMGIMIPTMSKECLRSYLRANTEEIRTKYIKYWLSVVDSKKREFERIYGYVIKYDLDKEINNNEERLRNYLLVALKKSGLTQSEVGRRLGTNMDRHYFGKLQWSFPTFVEYTKMQAFMDLPDDYFDLTQCYTILKRLQRLQSLERLQSLQRLQSLERLQSLQSLQSLERLQRLQSLQSLQSLQNCDITTSCNSYNEVEFERDSVVYCDPPYKDTACYGVEFSHDDFYKWLRNVNHPVFISEYSMPDDFIAIAQKEKRVLLSMVNSAGKPNAIEKIFIHESQLAKLNKPRRWKQLNLFDYEKL